MIGFLLLTRTQWSFRDFESESYPGVHEDWLARLTNWLVQSQLFEQAWAIVSKGHMNWWWSEKLCLFTVGYWTILLSTEGRARSVSHLWAYMLLGQVVAISVASNLFYVALLLSTEPSPSPSSPISTPYVLWLSVLPSLATVAHSPYTTEASFLPNLLGMHALILLPLIFPLNSSGKAVKTRLIHTIVTGLSIGLHAYTTVRTWFALSEPERTIAGFTHAALDTFVFHPAQSSISWDVVWTFISLAVWLYLAPLKRHSNPSNTKQGLQSTSSNKKES
ncbi:hypothetical protein BDW22DRAFT_1355730 [Trametopsis cervina]|nr:hypothetical protein BDW22DRAFT_1355730 [Trametopsis cervina]